MFSKVNFKSLFQVILTINIISSVISVEGNFEEMTKKSKVLACIAITKARMAQEPELFEMLAENINKVHNIQDGKNKMVSLCLVNCYSQIESEEAIQIITKMHSQGKIDALSELNRRLLGLLDTKTSANEISTEQFQNNFQEINKILKDLNKEHEKLKDPEFRRRKEEAKRRGNEQYSSEEEGEIEYPKLTFGDYLYKMFSPLFSFFSIFLYIFKFLQFDSVFGIGILIVFSFVLLNILTRFCQKKRPKKKAQVAPKTENSPSSTSDTSDVKKEN